jgi:hypothetical protein
MTRIDINAHEGWYITYKAGSGRSVAVGGAFKTKEDAQGYIDEMGKRVTPPTDLNEIMHVVYRAVENAEKQS